MEFWWESFGFHKKHRTNALANCAVLPGYTTSNVIVSAAKNPFRGSPALPYSTTACSLSLMANMVRKSVSKSSEAVQKR